MNQIKDLQQGRNQIKGFTWLSGWLISENLWIWVWGTELFNTGRQRISLNYQGRQPYLYKTLIMF